MEDNQIVSMLQEANEYVTQGERGAGSGVRRRMQHVASRHVGARHASLSITSTVASVALQ